MFWLLLWALIASIDHEGAVGLLPDGSAWSPCWAPAQRLFDIFQKTHLSKSFVHFVITYLL